MAGDSKYVNVTEQSFQSEVLDSDKPVLVDFWAEWCGPCKAIAPMIEELATDFEGKAKIAKLNVDEAPGIAQHWGWLKTPTPWWLSYPKKAGRCRSPGRVASPRWPIKNGWNSCCGHIPESD